MPNTIKATNLKVTRVFPKFFIAQDTFRKQDGSQGTQNFKIWWQGVVQQDQTVNVIGVASGSVNEFVDKNGQKVVYGQLTINATSVESVSGFSDQDTF